MQDLQRIGTTSSNTDYIASNVQAAARAALDLQQNLRAAINPDTGNLNLEAFNSNLRASGRTLADYQALLSSLGPSGQETFMNLARAIQQADEPLVRTNRLMSDLWTTMRNTVRWQITASALQGFTGAISEAYRYAQDLNESLTNIRIVTEYSTEQMREFAQYANESAQRLSTTTTDYTDAALIYYQQGLSEEEVQSRTETTIRLAQAAGISTQEASEELTAIWNNFYNGSQSLEYYADVLVRLGADTASSSEEISEGLQQFASVADAVGLSYEYAASALATITATTRESANTVGTALRTLFARFQGLQLGETLEDGVDLNKYSRALEQVGVQVLDVNGDLRDMDDILTDLGNVWETLSSAQQVALAQTVAGVRQYTRLVTLMDNWDFFQQNLAASYGAEGSLQVQADIYAESWEAARDRVTAAAENIYDSVINDQLFIDLDNALTPVLNTIADIADALGGLPGILALVATGMNRAFGDKIAQSLRDMVYNINYFRNRNQGSEAERLRTEAATMANNMAYQMAGQDASSPEYQNLEFQRQVVELRARARREAQGLTEIQQQQLQNDMRNIDNLQRQVDLYAQAATEANNIVRANEQQLRSSLPTSIVNEDGTTNLNRARAYQTLIGASDISDTSKAFDQLIENYKTAVDIQTRYAAANTRVVNSNNTVTDSVAAFVRSLNLQTEAQLNSTSAVRDYMSETGSFATEMNNANNTVTRYREALRALLIESGQFTESNVDNFLARLTQGYRDSTIANEQLRGSIDRGTESLNRQSQAIQNAAYRQRDWADVVMQSANVMAQTAMSLQSLQNIGNIFSGWASGEGSLSDITGLLTSLTMLMPQLTSVFNAQNRANLATAISTLGFGSAATTAAGGVMTLSTAIHTLLPVAGLIISVIGGVLVPIIQELVVTQEEAAQSIQDAGAAYDEAQNELSFLNSELQTTKDRIEEINSQDKISLTDRNELAQLERQNALLSQQVEIQERLAGIAQQEEIDTIRDNWSTAYRTPTFNTPWETEMLGNTYVPNGVYNPDTYEEAALDLPGLSEVQIEDIRQIAQNWRDAVQEEIINNQELYAQAEESFAILAQDYLTNPENWTNGEFEEYVNSIREWRDLMVPDEGDYFSSFVAPLLDSSELSNLSEQFYQALASGSGEAIFPALTEEAQRFLMASGVSAEEFGDILNAGVDAAVEGMSELEGYSEDFINNLTAEDWQALLTLNWDNLPEQIDSIYEALVYAHEQTPIEIFDEGNIKTAQDLLDQINDAQDPLRSALDTYREQGFLNINDVQDLIADNPEYSAFIQALGNGQYGLTEDALSAYQNMARAEEQALNQQLQENMAELIPDPSYLTGYLNTWQQIQEQFQTMIEESGGAVSGSAETFSTAIDNIESLTEAYQSNSISGAEYFSQLRDEVDSFGQYLSAAQGAGISGEGAMGQYNDFMGEVFTVLTTQISTGIEDTRKAFEAGQIDYQSYFDGIVEGSRALIDVYQDYYNGLEIASDGTVGFIKSLEDLTEAQQEDYEAGKITSEMFKDRESLTDDQVAAVDRLTTAYQELQEASSQQLFVNFVDDYADLFSAATIDGTLQLDLYAEASIENEQEVNDMLDAFGNRVSARLNSLYATDDAAYQQAIATLQSYGFQVEATGNHTAGEITQSAADNLNNFGAFITDMQGQTETTMGNLLTTIGTIMSAIGQIISNLDYTITMEGQTTEQGEFNLAKWALSGGKSGIKLPSFEYKITGTAGEGMQSGLDALVSAGEDIANNGQQYADIVGGMLGNTPWDQYTQSDNENPTQGNFPTYPNSPLLNPDDIPDEFYDTRGTGGGGGGGGGDAQQYDLEEPKALEDIEDRYHEINRQIERQADLLDDIDNATDRAYGTRRLAGYGQQIQELNGQLDNYNDKLAEAEGYLTSDKADLNSLFSGMVSFDENGEILGYRAIEQMMVDDYNAFLANYNAFIQQFNALSKSEQEARQAEYDSWQQQLQTAQDLFDRRQAALAQYEDTLDTIQEVRDSIEETQRAIADARLAQIEHRLEVVIDVHEARDAVRDLTREIAESFGDLLTHGMESTRLGWEDTQANMGLLSEYQQTYNEYLGELANADEYTDVDQIISNLQDLQDQVIGTAEDLLAWIEELEQVVPNAIDDARERFDQFINQLEHNDTIASAIEELYALQGVTIETEEGFNRLQSATQERLDAQVAQAQLQRQWFEEARDRLAQAEAALVGVSETDAQYDYLRNQRDALLEEYNSAQEAMLESAAAAMEAAQEMYTRALEKALNDFDNLLSDGYGLDFLQTQYDHFIDTEERYLDKVNEAYEVASWYNRLQADIDDTTDSAMRDRLEALQEEIDIRRENNTLSEYDLDILEAKYQVLQAQMALEEAQNNRNQLRLVRDSQGNWNYQYTADAEQIANAQQDLLDAENEWYNIAKDQVTDVTSEIITTWQECKDQIEQVYSDMTLSDEERAARAEEIYNYYTQKIQDLENEKQVAISDMNEAGNQSLIHSAASTGADLSDITQMTSEELQAIVEQAGMNINDLLLKDQQTMIEIFGQNSEVVNLFDNTYADALSNMTSNTVNFEAYLEDLLNQAEGNFNNYRDTVANVANDTGTSLGDLDGYLNQVSDSTGNLAMAGQNATDMMWQQIDAIMQLCNSYAQMLDLVYQNINAQRDLANAIANTIASEANRAPSSSAEDESGLGYDPNTDYNQLISDGIRQGWLTYGSSEYRQLNAQREAKIKGENLSHDYAIIEGQEAEEYFAGLTQDGGYGVWGNKTLWDNRLHMLGISGYASGGYTGEFDNGRLAILHEKELVLNQEDTKNILAAVELVRSFTPELMRSIESTLDNNVVTLIGALADKISGSTSIASTHDTIEQSVTIERVEFPNVTSSDEIQDAFASLVNDAAQWASRRKS